MTTSVWPSDATASAAANGNIVRSVPRVTLDEAKIQLTAKRPTVAISTVASPRESSRREPRGMLLIGSVRPVVGTPDLT